MDDIAAVLQSLRDHAVLSKHKGDGWAPVNFHNAKPASMDIKTYYGCLAELSKAQLYKPGKLGWAIVRLIDYNVVKPSFDIPKRKRYYTKRP